MKRFEIEYPEGYKAPNTGISKGARAVSKGAEAVQEFVPSIGDAARNVARTAARAGEAVLGAPADLATAALGLGGLAEQVIGGEPQILSQLHGAASKYLPTSENIRKYGTEKVAEKILPENYLNPQGEYEKRWDGLVDTVASLGSPLLGPAKAGIKLATKLGLSGEFAKWGAEKVGFGEFGQAVTSTGAMLATSLAGSPRMIERAKGLYNESKAAAKELKGIKRFVSSEKLIEGVKETRKIIGKGLNNPAKKIVLEDLKTIEKKIKGNLVPLEEVVEFQKNINERIYKSTNKVDYKAASEYLNPVKSSSIDTIKDAAKTHPKVANPLLAADELWAAIKNDDPIGEFLTKRINYDINKLKSPVTKGLLSTMAGAAATAIPVVGNYVGGTLIGGGAGIVAYTGYKAVQVFNKSPVARKIYKDLLTSTLKKNVPATLKNIRKLDHIFMAEDEKQGGKEGRYEIEYPS